MQKHHTNHFTLENQGFRFVSIHGQSELQISHLEFITYGLVHHHEYLLSMSQAQVGSPVQVGVDPHLARSTQSILIHPNFLQKLSGANLIDPCAI